MYIKGLFETRVLGFYYKEQDRPPGTFVERCPLPTIYIIRETVIKYYSRIISLLIRTPPSFLTEF